MKTWLATTCVVILIVTIAVSFVCIRAKHDVEAFVFEEFIGEGSKDITRIEFDGIRFSSESWVTFRYQIVEQNSDTDATPRYRFEADWNLRLFRVEIPGPSSAGKF